MYQIKAIVQVLTEYINGSLFCAVIYNLFGFSNVSKYCIIGLPSVLTIVAFGHSVESKILKKKNSRKNKIFVHSILSSQFGIQEQSKQINNIANVQSYKYLENMNIASICSDINIFTKIL